MYFLVAIDCLAPSPRQMFLSLFPNDARRTRFDLRLRRRYVNRGRRDGRECSTRTQLSRERAHELGFVSLFPRPEK